MPYFKSKEEAINTHKTYHHDTDSEGKFTKLGHSGQSRVQGIIDWVPQESIVLEMGCNTGGLSRRIQSDKNCFVYGIDICKSAVELAKQKGIFAQVAEAEKVPFEDDKFDVVVASEIFEHLYDPKVVLKEAVRVLKPKGILVGSVPHSLGENAKKGIKSHPYHARIYTRDKLFNFLRPYFKDIQIIDIHYDPDLIGKPQWMNFLGKR